MGRMDSIESSALSDISVRTRQPLRRPRAPRPPQGHSQPRGQLGQGDKSTSTWTRHRSPAPLLPTDTDDDEVKSVASDASSCYSKSRGAWMSSSSQPPASPRTPLKEPKIFKKPKVPKGTFFTVNRCF